MSANTKNLIVGIGNIYLETNFLGLMTNGIDNLKIGKEYSAPKWEMRLGGSVVNFAIQGKKLGLQVIIMAKVGKDDAGEKLFSLLEKENISTDLIVSSNDLNIQTNIDSGLVFENGNNIQVVAGNANQNLALKDIDLYSSLFERVSSLYVGGFLKQKKLYRDYPLLFKKLKEKGIKIFLDHGRIPVDVGENELKYLRDSLYYVEGYFPNLEELTGFSGQEDVEKALTKVLDLGPKFIAVKMGKDGCRVVSKKEDFYNKGHNIKAISTVGAGDVFNAGFIYQYLMKETLKKSAEFANAAAALRVSQNKNPSLNNIVELLNK